MKSESKKFSYSEIPLITLALAVLFIIIQLVTGTNYPVFRDELYYIECANHPALGYVDHPPLSILILTAWKTLFGDSLLSIRIIPALFGAALIILTSQLTNELGGSKIAQIFSSVTLFSGLYFLATGGFYSMNVIDSVFWAVLFLILLKIINLHYITSKKSIENSPEHRSSESASRAAKIKNPWIWFGIIAGLGLMNKISVGYLGLSIILAIILTHNRAWLKQKNIWLGGVIAVVIFLPYVIWNVLNDYATLEFIRNAQQYKIAVLSPVDFLKEQILLINPLSAPVWLAGLITLLFGPLKKYRVIGIAYVVILLLLIVMRAKPYYLAAAYPVLIAAGSVSLASLKPKILFRYIYPVLLFISMVIFSPLVIPVLSPECTVKYIETIGIMPSSGERNNQSSLPQILADRFGWIEMAEKIARIYNTLPDNEKKLCGIYGRNYGEAGAIDYYGKKFNLPKAMSGHNNYWLWGPPQDTFSVVIIIGGSQEDHLRSFNEVTEVDRTSSSYSMPYENDIGIFLCRGLKKPLKELWPDIKFYI